MSTANDNDDDDDDAGGIAVLVAIYICGLVDHMLVLWRSGMDEYVRHCRKGRILVPDSTNCSSQTHTASCRHILQLSLCDLTAAVFMLPDSSCLYVT